MTGILVGIDGSHTADAALRWAVEEARLRSLPLTLLHTYGPRDDEGVIAAALGTGAAAEAKARQAATLLLEHTVDGLGEEAKDVEIRTAAVAGQPAAALLEYAREADLLVVGARGRGGFAGLLLGSVSQQCIQHAMCPIVVVRRRGHP